MKTRLKQILIFAVLVPLFTGCIVYRERPAPAYAPQGEIVVETPPPPPPVQVEIVPVAPGPPNIWFWIPGCWEWRGHYVWVRGHWAPRPHPGAVWVSGGWVRRGHGHVWVAGHWR